jgi:hypothetical protein
MVSGGYDPVGDPARHKIGLSDGDLELLVLSNMRSPS